MPQQSPELLAALKLKFKAAFDAMEREAPTLTKAPFGIGHVAVGVVLGYADFRYAKENWRDGRPQLAVFAETVLARPSFKSTTHIDTY